MKRGLTFSALILGAPLLLSGCLSDYPQFQTVDQSNLCVAASDEQAMACPEGELFMARVMQPNPATRAFNVLNTAALYCDTNYPIFENPAGVMCVLTHQRVDMLTGAEPSAQGMGTAQEEASQDAAQEDSTAESQ
ncbi:hypothetical protein ACGTN6_03420 [Halomonas sp. THAF12]|uniref:hypothetical protein n=1 Tax=Halomonas sp. B23F22_10 TaxID=3459515 RepID=UPI00373E98C7